MNQIWQVMGRVSARIIWQARLVLLLFQQKRFWHAMNVLSHTIAERGLGAARERISNYSQHMAYSVWVNRYDTLTDKDRNLIRQHIAMQKSCPVISILMRVCDPTDKYLVRAIDSVRHQLYPFWQLCIVDDASASSTLRSYIEACAAEDSRIKISFRNKKGGDIPAQNEALSLASGEFVGFLGQHDQLTEHALYLIAVALADTPDLVFLYGDEDSLDEQQQRFQPHFKPDWNPELLHSWNYVGRLVVCATACVRLSGGLREGFGESADWDFVLRMTENLSEIYIRHIPYVLYHRGVSSKAVEHIAETAPGALRAVTEHIERRGLAAQALSTWGGHVRVRHILPDPAPGVSILIPTRNGLHLLQRCVDSLFERTDYPDFEVVVIDNQSDDPAMLAYLDVLAKKPNARVLHYEAPFNFAALTNCVVHKVHKPLLCFLNNDTEIISADWLAELASHAARPEVGAVGGMLYFPNNSIQHAGVILGIGMGHVAGHWYVKAKRGITGYFGRAALAQNFSAVTAACMVLRKAVYEDVGGMDEAALAVAYNDVDLCLRIRKNGYRIVWTPHAELYHHESASRGKDISPEKRARFKRETGTMQARWGSLLRNDPAYNPNLTLNSSLPFLADPPRVTRPWLSFGEAPHDFTP